MFVRGFQFVRFSQIIEVWFIIWGSKFVNVGMVDKSTSDSCVKGYIMENEFMAKFCVFPINQKSFEKSFDDRRINEIHLCRMIVTYCLYYIFGWYIEIFNQCIDKLCI